MTDRETNSKPLGRSTSGCNCELCRVDRALGGDSDSARLRLSACLQAQYDGAAIADALKRSGLRHAEDLISAKLEPVYAVLCALQEKWPSAQRAYTELAKRWEPDDD